MDQQLLTDARAGRLTKQALADQLTGDRRRRFLTACAAIEKTFTAACTASHDPCLESGCSLEGEICLEPLMRAEEEYQKACGAEWLKIVAQ
jgi:hypothetical protein